MLPMSKSSSEIGGWRSNVTLSRLIFSPVYSSKQGFFYSLFQLSSIMQKSLNLVLIVTILISVSALAQPAELIEIKRIKIPEEVFLGGFLKVDMQNDHILITDNSIGQVVLFDGSEWKALDPKECHPGFWFQPIQAKFGNNDEIFITNSGHWGFRFKKNGECLGVATGKSIAPDKFYYGKDIIGINSDFNQKNIKAWDSKGREKEEIFSVVNKFPNAEYRVEGGGLFEVEDVVYFAKVFEPIMYSFDRNTVVLKRRDFDSEFFNPLKEDIPSDVGNPNLMKEVSRVFRNNAMIQNLFQLNEDSGFLIFSRYLEGETNYYGVIFNLNNLTSEEIFEMDNNPVFVGNNEFVFIERENDGYEDEVIEIVFKRVKRN